MGALDETWFDVVGWKEGTCDSVWAKVIDGELVPECDWTGRNVRVWWVNLDKREGDANLLGRSELERARRFHSEVHRRRFISAHSALRAVLSQFVPAQPADLAFGSYPAGKPYLLDFPRMHFSLTHSQWLGGIAVSTESPVGLDCEVFEKLPDCSEIALRIMSGTELASLFSVDAVHRDRYFYRGWTRKEAAAKAVGVGLGLDFKEISSPLLENVAEYRLDVGGVGIAITDLQLGCRDTAAAAIAVQAQSP